MAPKSFDLQGSSKVKFAIFTTTFVDLYRSNGGSYDFGAMETFVQRAKIYKYTNFHPNRTGGKFPIGSLPCPLVLFFLLIPFAIGCCFLVNRVKGKKNFEIEKQIPVDANI